MSDQQFRSGRNKKSDPRLPTTSGSRSQDDFQKAYSILESAEGFGGALWDAEMRAAFDAKQKVQKARKTDKSVVFQECMHNLRESMVAEIEVWAPRYVELAEVYPQLTDANPTEWTRDRMQNLIDKRLKKPDLDGAVAFCLITMSGGDILEKHKWLPPEWMCAPSETLFTIRHEHEGVALRLAYALKKVLARLEVGIVLARGKANASEDVRNVLAEDLQRDDSLATGHFDVDPEREIIRKKILANPTGTVRNGEAAIYFGVKTKTIREWIVKKKLRPGAKRSTVSNASIIALEALTRS